MSERLKQLAEQAGMIIGDASNFDMAKFMPKEVKFAELIVKECAEQIVAKGTDWIDFSPSQTGVRPEYWDMAQQIKQHFGVKE